MKHKRTFKVKEVTGNRLVVSIAGNELEQITTEDFVLFKTKYLIKPNDLQDLLNSLNNIVPDGKRALLIPSFIEYVEFVEDEEQPAGQIVQS